MVAARAVGAWRKALPAGPGRLLVAGSFINSVGTGLWMPANILYFSREVGIPASHVALGMSTAGVVGLFGSSMIGRVIHRQGPRRTLVAMSVLQTLVVSSYLFVDSFAVYLPLVVTAVFAGRSGQVCRNVLIARVAAGEEAARLQALARSGNNAGFSLGVAATGLLMQLPELSPYPFLLAGNALSYVATASAAAWLPRDLDERSGGRKATARRSGVLRDRPFVAVTALTLVLSMRDALLFVGLPLWVTEHTSAPKALVAALILVNTVLCVLFQVRASRGTGDLAGGARALRRSGIALAAGCLAFWAGSTGGALTASVLLLCGAVLHTLGELWQSAGAWGVSYALSPEGRLPDYQAFFSLTNVGRDVLGPTVVTMVVVGWEGPGWGVLALAFCAVGLALPVAAGWAHRTRLAAEGGGTQPGSPPSGSGAPVSGNDRAAP